MRVLNIIVLSATVLLFVSCESAIALIEINEIRIDQPFSDDEEYFELRGPIGAALGDLTYLVLGDTGASTSGANGLGNSGIIEAAIDLTGMSIPASGYFLATEDPNFSLGGAIVDLVTPLNFENNDNVTHLLVRNFTGALLDDLDANDDGSLNGPDPWSELLDAVGLVEVQSPQTLGQEWAYGAELGFVDVGPDAGITPGHVFRAELQLDTFHIGQFDPANGSDTPGAQNIAQLSCDFDNNGTCDVSDMNLMYARGNLRIGVNALAGDKFDLDGNLLINNGDMNRWLGEAARVNGYSDANDPNLPDPYLRGDTDGLGAVHPTARTVDITDFSLFLLHFGSDSASDPNLTGWDDGNFDGDGDIDITDFSNHFLPNFNITGGGTYGPGQSAPEPTSAMLLAVGALIVIATLLARRP